MNSWSLKKTQEHWYALSLNHLPLCKWEGKEENEESQSWKQKENGVKTERHTHLKHLHVMRRVCSCVCLMSVCERLDIKSLSFISRCLNHVSYFCSASFFEWTRMTGSCIDHWSLSTRLLLKPATFGLCINEFLFVPVFLSSFSTMVTLLASPVVIAICHRKSVRLTGILGGLVTALGCLFTSFATQFHQLFFSYGIFIGVGVAMIRDPAVIIMGQYFKKKRQLVEIPFHASQGLGIAFMPLLITFCTRYSISFRQPLSETDPYLLQVSRLEIRILHHGSHCFTRLLLGSALSICITLSSTTKSHPSPEKPAAKISSSGSTLEDNGSKFTQFCLLFRDSAFSEPQDQQQQVKDQWQQYSTQVNEAEALVLWLLGLEVENCSDHSVQHLYTSFRHHDSHPPHGERKLFFFTRESSPPSHPFTLLWSDGQLKFYCRVLFSQTESMKVAWEEERNIHEILMERRGRSSCDRIEYVKGEELLSLRLLSPTTLSSFTVC